jgi:hypothetical protein
VARKNRNVGRDSATRLPDFTSVPSTSRISNSGVRLPGELPTFGPVAGDRTVSTVAGAGVIEVGSGDEADLAAAGSDAPQARAATAASTASAATLNLIDNL